MSRAKLVLLPLVFFLALAALPAPSRAHNITRILAKHPEYSTFNSYLTLTHLAGEINRRLTITVLVVNNAAMSSLISKGFSVYTIRNVLSLHVLVDYFGTKKLHQLSKGTTLVSSLFQATGAASGTSGYVNITIMRGGKVGLGVKDSEKLTAHFVKSVYEKPYNISVLEISQVLTSEEAEAPTAGPSAYNLTTILSKQGCKSFADLLTATGADTTFQANIEAGLTVFCPTDAVLKSFMPRYRNLTASQKVSLLLYHGLATYNSVQMFKQNNGVINTLASDRTHKYELTIQTEGEGITLETTVVTAKVTGTVLDQEPLACYKVNKVLLPPEQFKPTVTATRSADEADGPDADAPEGESDDQVADNDNGAHGIGAGRLAVVVLSVCMGVLLM